ncbi:MAG: type II toxin-antitoxin system VapC family toxin [Planctomycetota bacterium]
MWSELAVVDTNILVHAKYEDSEHYPVCSRLLDRAQDGQEPLCISPQVLGELYSTITSPRRVSDPFTPQEALEVVAQFLTMPGMAMLPVPGDVVQRWVRLVRRHPVTAGRIFDLQLIATMLGNGVHRIYTYNASDFEPFDEIEVLTP